METKSASQKRKIGAIEYFFGFVILVAIIWEDFIPEAYWESLISATYWEDIISETYWEDTIPETYIYLGKDIPNSYMKEIKSLGLIEQDEKIEYFYTDGIFDIQTGMYFVTNRHLVLYSSSWEEPKTILDFDSITNLVPEYDNSFLGESVIFVETEDLEIHFPLSNEKKRDRAFVDFLKKKMNAE